ncbi:MAG: hypothetical protein ACOCTN_03895 [Candidatus Natronoplasma sp.]
MMRCDRLLSIFAIMILIFSGLAVIVNLGSGEELEIEQNEKRIEDFEDISKEDRPSKESKSESLERKDQDDQKEESKTTKTIEDTQNDFEGEIENEMISDVDDNTVLMKSTDVDEKTDHSQYIDGFTSMDEDNSNQESILSNDHELIIDDYEIIFKDDMTSLETDTTFDIYRIDVDGVIYTADDIRNANNTEELIETIEGEITYVFRDTIDSVFPHADKQIYDTISQNYEEGTSGPIKITTSADIDLTRKSLGFEEENDQLDTSEVIRETMNMEANINKDVELRFREGHHSTYRFEVPKPYLMGDWDDQEDRASIIEVNNSDGSKEESKTRELDITHETPRYTGTQEEISIEGIFELENLEQIDITFNNSISSINIEKYGDFTIPNVVENLTYVDADFIRTSVDNGLVEWKTITDEMNNSIEEIEDEMPGFFEGVDFIYNDPGIDTGTIIRKYEVENFQPSITTDDEDIDIDNELVESLMNSGATIDFGFSGMGEEYDDYSTLLKIRTPDFMVLHDSGGEIPQEDGYYEIDPKEDFGGEFRSNLEEEELPDEQSISVDTDIDIESVNLDFDLNAVANTKVDGKIEVEAVEATQDMKDSLSEEITLEYAMADLIRQVEKRDIFDKQQILNMTRDGEDIDDFEGMDQILRDALGKENVDVSTEFQEGTWQSVDEEIQPIVLLIDSEFELPLRESGNGNAFDIYSMEMGEFEIPSVEGIETDFRIIFPSSIRGEVEETDNVKTGETSDSRSYIEVNMPGDSDDSITIDPEIIITSGILLSTDICLYGMPLVMIPIIIILIISSIVGLVVWKKRGPDKDQKKKELIRRGMEDALMKENDPDRWLAYIPQEKIDNYQITQDTLFELGLEEELQEMRRRMDIEKVPPPPPPGEKTYREDQRVEETEEIEETEEDLDTFQEENEADEEIEEIIDQEGVDDEMFEEETTEEEAKENQEDLDSEK